MKRKSIFFAVIFFLASAAIVWAAQKTLTTYTWDRDIGVVASSGGGGPFDPPGGSDPIVSDEDDPIIVVDPETGIIEFLPIGDASGAIWYQGTTTGCNPCNLGRCTFGVGFRSYFEFRFTTPDTSTDSTDQADGFTFSVVNASNNDTSKRGGFPNTSGSMGELLGYAGSGNTSPTSSEPRATPPLDGLGLEPPKFAIEFDTYPSTGGIQYDGCSGGRQDNNNNNHIALMFWGNNPNSNQMCDWRSTAGNTFPRASFDDNIHRSGDGTTSNPYNSAASGNGSGLGGYYERARSGGYNWLEDGSWHRVRIEVIRTPSSAAYQVKAWINCESLNLPYTACPSGELVYFQNVLNPYDNSSYLPKIDRTQPLSGTYNAMLNEIFLGFTVGTGGRTQGVEIRDFAVYFPTVSIDPTSRTHTYSSASGQTVIVTAAAGSCSWTAVSNDGWITITGGASGTGNGTVTYSITANSGAERTGTITIGGQTFTVDQAAMPPLYCTGGTESSDGGYRVHTFTATGSSSLVCTGVGTAQVFAIGGGGRGANMDASGTYGTGGGGGGAFASSVVTLSSGTYSVNVGAGSTSASPGGDSWFGSISTVMAKGGNSVATNQRPGATGGAAAESVGTTRWSGGTGGTGSSNSPNSGGGGGGAGTTGAGGNASGSTAGTGTAIWGGNGGAGLTNPGDGNPGSAYGGGGSGGCKREGSATRTGGAGGSGVVIIRY